MRIDRVILGLALSMLLPLAAFAQEPPASGPADTMNVAISKQVVRDTEIDAYLGLLLKRLTSAAVPGLKPHPQALTLELHLVRSPLSHVFQTGGKHVYITSAAFSSCKKEEDLASKLAAVLAQMCLNSTWKVTGSTTNDLALSIAGVQADPETDSAAQKWVTDLLVRGGWGQEQVRDALQRAWPAIARDWSRANVADPETFKSLATSTVLDMPVPNDESAKRVLAIMPGTDPTQVQARESLKQRPPDEGKVPTETPDKEPIKIPEKEPIRDPIKGPKKEPI